MVKYSFTTRINTFDVPYNVIYVSLLTNDFGWWSPA